MLDFGANIVQKSFLGNYYKIQKSINIEKLEDKVTLLTNGLSNVRGEIKKLSSDTSNVGGQELLPENHANELNAIDFKNDKYMVETILMNDIVTILPADFKRAVMKIDIQGYEIQAFTKAEKLFARVDIVAVFIEWVWVKSLHNNLNTRERC